MEPPAVVDTAAGIPAAVVVADIAVEDTAAVGIVGADKHPGDATDKRPGDAADKQPEDATDKQPEDAAASGRCHRSGPVEDFDLNMDNYS